MSVSQIKQVLDRKKNIFLSDKLSENYISCGILITLAKVFKLSVMCTTLNTHFGSI